MKIGLIQMHCSKDREQNRAKAIEQIRTASSRGASVICLPELFCTEYFCYERNKSFFELAEPIPGPTTTLLIDLARELGITLIASLFEKSAEGKYFNTTAVIDSGTGLLGIYRKMHIPDDPLNNYDEAYYFTQGDLGFKTFETRFGPIAPMICFDQWFPEGARINAANGAKLLFYPTAIGWPLASPKERLELNRAEHDAWITVQRGHAISNTVFVAACNRVGKESRLNFWGSSFVADPYGRLIAKASEDKEETLIVDCNFQVIDEMRKEWPFLSARRIRL